MMTDLQTLVVDDEPTVRSFMEQLLSTAGHSVTCAMDATEALLVLHRQPIDLVFLDVDMPGTNGIALLREIKRFDRNITVIMVTGVATVRQAVEAMKLGASEFLSKPFSIDAVRSLLRTVRKRKEEGAACPLSAEAAGDPARDRAIVAQDPVMLGTIDLIDRIAPLPSTVLIEGESGTGKELVARRIHATSTVASGPFVAFNCAVIPHQLLESELFGHEKGAFTGATTRKTGFFEASDGGTLFIDEISEMGLELQVKLLRVLQERSFRRVGGIKEIPVRGRILAATNKPLDAEVENGRFRKDLYYRINVLKVTVPPLRERRLDIPLLSLYFLERFSRLLRKPISGIDEEVIERFMAYRWEGNVRELQNVIERAVVMADVETIGVSEIPESISRSVARARASHRLTPFQAAKDQFELEYLSTAMQETGGNITLASRMTGISRQHFYDKLARHGLEQARFRPSRGGVA